MSFIRESISKAVVGENLSETEARNTMSEIMTGAATPSQIASLLTALSIKGETVDEIASFATIMREHARRINPNVSSPLVDTCGTGGDVLKIFNVSTIAALVVSGSGSPVAKHGNRSFTSKCGSADLLERFGVNIRAEPEVVRNSIEQSGIGFMFASVFHSASKNASSTRREIGIRTVFNLLGPLTNPANAKIQLVGVYDDSLVSKMAQVLRKLAIERAIVVHGLDGLDEISIIGNTHAARLDDNEIHEEILTPASFGLSKRKLDEIAASPEIDKQALTTFRILADSGTHSEKERSVKDMILMNSSAVIVSAGKAKNYKEGVEIARESLDSGKALEKLTQLVKHSGGETAKLETLQSQL